MGFYYGPSPSPQNEEEKPPGCMDVFVITRAILGLLLIPIAALFLVIADLAAIIWLLTVHPALALIPISLTAVAVWLLARWDRRRGHPPDFHV